MSALFLVVWLAATVVASSLGVLLITAGLIGTVASARWFFGRSTENTDSGTVGVSRKGSA
jgi:hypothetical protein